MIKERHLTLDNGMTLITVEETDEAGNTICSACGKILPTYAQGVTVDDNTRRFYSVHKRCRVKEQDAE